MANTTYTNLTALEALAALVPESNTNLAEKVTKMIASEERKRDAAKNAKRENPNKKKNAAKLREVMRVMVEAGNEPRGSRWIGEHVNDMMTPQKVAGIMNIGRAEGWIDYGKKEKGLTTWFVTETGIAELA